MLWDNLWKYFQNSPVKKLNSWTSLSCLQLHKILLTVSKKNSLNYLKTHNLNLKAFHNARFYISSSWSSSNTDFQHSFDISKNNFKKELLILLKVLQLFFRSFFSFLVLFFYLIQFISKNHLKNMKVLKRDIFPSLMLIALSLWTFFSSLSPSPSFVDIYCYSAILSRTIR